MVAALAFAATAISTLFCQSTAARYARHHRSHELSWAVALGMFALASALLATGVSTGWDEGLFRAYYLLGAVLTVPWLALGTVHLLASERVARITVRALLVFSGFAGGVILAAPINTMQGTAIPEGRHLFGGLPRVLAAAGSGIGATVVLTGALWSSWRFLRRGQDKAAAGANVLVATGVLITSAGGTLQGFVGHDEAFALSLAVGIAVIYGGFLVGARASDRRSARARESFTDFP